MKFQLLAPGWPVKGGAVLVPAGTILDRADWQWLGIALPWPPPINAMALDQEAYDELLKHHWSDAHRLMTPAGGGINRHGDFKH